MISVIKIVRNIEALGRVIYGVVLSGPGCRDTECITHSLHKGRMSYNSAQASFYSQISRRRSCFNHWLLSFMSVLLHGM